MARLVAEALQTVLQTVEVLKQDLQADNFKPTASDLMIGGANTAKEIDKAFLCFYGACIVLLQHLQTQVVLDDVCIQQISVLIFVNLLNQHLLVDFFRLALRNLCVLLHELLGESLDQSQTTVSVVTDLVEGVGLRE